MLRKSSFWNREFTHTPRGFLQVKLIQVVLQPGQDTVFSKTQTV